MCCRVCWIRTSSLFMEIPGFDVVKVWVVVVLVCSTFELVNVGAGDADALRFKLHAVVEFSELGLWAINRTIASRWHVYACRSIISLPCRCVEQVGMLHVDIPIIIRRTSHFCTYSRRTNRAYISKLNYMCYWHLFSNVNADYTWIQVDFFNGVIVVEPDLILNLGSPLVGTSQNSIVVDLKVGAIRDERVDNWVARHLYIYMVWPFISRFVFMCVHLVHISEYKLASWGLVLNGFVCVLLSPLSQDEYCMCKHISGGDIRPVNFEFEVDSIFVFDSWICCINRGSCSFINTRCFFENIDVSFHKTRTLA